MIIFLRKKSKRERKSLKDKYSFQCDFRWDWPKKMTKVARRNEELLSGHPGSVSGIG